MPRNLAGLYSLPAGSIVADGVDDILASQHNTPLQDIASDLNAARPVATGGTGATTEAGARTNLGLAIGTNVQAYDAGLQSIAGLSWVADRYPYTTGVDTFALGTITAFGRSVLDDVDEAAALTTLGIGGDIPVIEALSGTGIAVRTGTNTWATRTITSPDSSVTVTNPGGVAGNVELTVPRTAVLLATKTASASATLDFTEMNNAIYSRHLVVLKSVKPATDAVSLGVRFSTDGGTTYAGGPTDYSHANTGRSSSGDTTASNSTGLNYLALTNTNGGVDVVGNAAGEDGVSGQFIIYNAPSATLKTGIRGEVYYDNTAGQIFTTSIAGRQNTAADTDALRFLFSSGNIASGTIELWGLV